MNIKLTFYHQIIFTFFVLTPIFNGLVNAQPQCHTNRFPEVLPLQYGQQASINLQKYIWGTNITYKVQPNDFHSNLQPQYSCKKSWSHRLGKIIQTEKYQLKINNKTQLYLAMLGSSPYFNDMYMIYYGVKGSSSSQNKEQSSTKNISEQKILPDSQNLKQDDVLVLQVPRNKIKNCNRFSVFSNSTHLEFLLDCMSPQNKMNRILAITTIWLAQSKQDQNKWVFIQSPIYLPEQLVPKLNITTSISLIQIANKNKNKLYYLVRIIMTEYADYIQVWRWIEGSKEIIGLYDTSFFMDKGFFSTNDIDLRKMQSIGDTILVMDLINGLHILQLAKNGNLIYKSTLQTQTFNTFYYDLKQQLLFMAKKGIVEQFQIKILPSSKIKANRVERYHLYGFEQIKQMVVQNRYLYVSTNMYLHIIHLTNIPSNDQQYDGSYNVYPQYYNQIMVPLTAGFLKVDASQSVVDVSQCETHPPFLHLKAPQGSNQFTIQAVSVINGVSVPCNLLHVKSVAVQADDDFVYLNGYDSLNDAIFSNRPGRAIMDLNKYAVGRNLQYQINLYNHKIDFEYKIRKVNNQTCKIKRSSQSQQQSLSSKIKQLKANNPARTFSIGNWLIVQYPQNRIKQYYLCQKYASIQCSFVQLSIMTTTQTKSAYHLLQQQRTKKQSILEAVLFTQNNQTNIEVNMVSQNEKTISSNNRQNLSLVRSLCRIRSPQGQQYKVTEIKLRADKLYVVLPYLKQIRIYEALFSFEQNQQCHYFGSLNLSSFSTSQDGFYFAPKHIDFDKQQLHRPFVLPSFNQLSKVKNPNLLSVSEGVETIFISQYNEVKVVRVSFNSDTITRVELLKQLILDRNVQSSDIELIVALPNILAVDKSLKIIKQYYLSHTFDRTFVRSYDFYQSNATNINDTNIQLIDSTRFAATVQPDNLNNSYVQVYEIDSLVASFKQFAKFKVDGKFHIMSFIDNQYEFLTIKQQQTSTQQLICNSTTLTPFPYVQIEIPKPNYNDEPSTQQFFLSSFTQKDSRREVITLQVASDSSDIQKGIDYPYITYSVKIQEDQEQRYFGIDDSKWFEGNVWTHRYVCNDCRNGRITFQDKITLKQKIQLQSFNVPNDFYVTQQNVFLHQYTFQTIEGYLLTKMTQQQQNNTWLSVQNSIKSLFGDDQMNSEFFQEEKQNLTYIFSQSLILSSNIENDPTCIKASPQEHDLYFVSMCSDYEFLDESALIELRLYSTTGFKTFVIHEYLIEIGDLTQLPSLKAGTKSQKQLIVMSSSLNNQEEGNYDTVFVRFDDNIWIFLIINGRFQLIYTIDKIDFGPQNHLCWMEVVKRVISSQNQQKNHSGQRLNKSFTQYGIIGSMCESGIYNVVFRVDPPQLRKSNTLQTEKQPLPSFHLLTQQQIDMELQLQRSRIQLPQHSYFLQTIPKPINNQTNEYELHMIVSNFNSFIWRVSLIEDSLIIKGMQLIGIIRRYNQYTPIQVTSHGDRYFSVLYRSTQNVNVSEFLAFYDSEYSVFNIQKKINEYFMFSVLRTDESPIYSKKSQVFQIGNRFFVLRENEIKLFDATNLLRMKVQKKIPSQLNSTEDLQGKQLTTNEQNPILYSQSIIIFVETPTQVNSVSIKLYSVDIFQLSGWTIALIVFGGIFALIILYFFLSQAWKYYQKRRKLVRLETHLLDEASSSGRDSQDQNQFDGEQIQANRPQGRQSQITTQQGTLSKSLLERYRQFEPENENKDQIKQ